MLHPRSRLMLQLFLCMLLVPTLAFGQTIAVPDVGSIGIGAYHYRGHRDMRDGYTPDWSDNGLAVHVAATHRVILAGMGWYEPAHTDSRFPTRRYEGFAIGGSGTAYALVSGDYRVGVSIMYLRTIGFDHSPTRFDKVVERTTAAIQVERTLSLKRVSALLWVAPAYLRDRYFQYPGLQPEGRAASHRDFGVIVGSSVTLWGHAVPFVQFGFVEYPQSYFGFNYIY